MTAEVGIHAAIIFREELRDKSKATAKYCREIRGAKIMKKVSSEQQRASLTTPASNSVSESLHKASTDFLQVLGTISIPHAASMGRSRTSNDHGHAHKNLVKGRKSKRTIDSKKGAYLEGMATIFFQSYVSS